ncbi:phospholipase effector Tle1 domain-containing protein [Nocardioides sediminis]|uniref:phospholipase effector Tle1 domain-containing protein n=1 Tax=Nocardioides sediminis TaxID=433648 RepID=UPI00389969BA
MNSGGLSRGSCRTWQRSGTRVALDEWRSKCQSQPCAPTTQDLLQGCFAGVHSDVGGTYPKGVPLSGIPLKWIVDEARAHGLGVRSNRYRDLCTLNRSIALGDPHPNSGWWRVLGRRRRRPLRGRRCTAVSPTGWPPQCVVPRPAARELRGC